MKKSLLLALLSPAVPLTIAFADAGGGSGGGGSGEHRHHGPPPEAVEACKTVKQGDACSFTHRDHQITGTCEAPPDHSDHPLACRPAHMPPPPEPNKDDAEPPEQDQN